MQISLHRNARTTLKIRKEIKSSKESIYALSKKYNLSWNTSKRNGKILKLLKINHQDLKSFKQVLQNMKKN